MNMRQQIKRDARRALKGYRVQAFVAAGIPLGVCILFLLFYLAFATMVDSVVGAEPSLAVFGAAMSVPVAGLCKGAAVVVIALFAFVFLSPLQMGLKRYYRQIAEGCPQSVSQVLLYYATMRSIWHTIAVRFGVLCRKLLWTVVFYCVPAALLLYTAAQADAMNAARQAALIASAIVLFVAATIGYVAFGYRYYMTDFLYAQGGDSSVRSIVKRSVRLTKGRHFELLMLDLSLWMHYLCSVLIVTLPYTLPSMGTVRALQGKVLEATAPDER